MNMQDAIKCPWNVVKALCEITNPIVCSHAIESVGIFECSATTLGVIVPAPKPRLNPIDRTRKQTPEPFIVRIEKFTVVSFPDLIERFDTVLAATREDRASAEIMLEMLGDSMEGS